MFKDSKPGMTHSWCTQRKEMICCCCTPHEGCDFTDETLTFTGGGKDLERYLALRKKRFTLPRRNKLIKKIKKKYGEAIKKLGKK